MSPTRPTHLAPPDLRRSAETASDLRPPPTKEELGEAEVRRILHELQVHQIELEMQNAELQRSGEEIETLLEAYTDLYDYAPVGYITLDKVGRIQRANLTAAALLGMDRSTLLGWPLARSVAEDGRETFSSFLKDRFEGVTQSFCELHLSPKAGAVAWIRMEASGPAMTHECRVAFTDYTIPHQAEDSRLLLDQQLRDQQFYTRSLIEASIDALLTTDPQGIITDTNQQTEALTGRSQSELIGSPFSALFTDPMRADASIKQALIAGRVADFVLATQDEEGRTTDVSFNATTFYNRERMLQGVFISARDVTEHRRLDRLLQEQNLELQRAKNAADLANRSKSDFLSSMSHELRSPLNAILGFAQLMEIESPAATPSQKASLGRILKAGWHLLELINEILDLTKIEAGKLSLSFQAVSLCEVLTECEDLIKGQAQRRELELRFPRFDSPFAVHADRTRLKQVLVNLLSNAVKYNRPRGSVEVTCAEPLDGVVRISIRDTGEGLSPDQLQQLFQPFNRLGREAGGEEGTGIGLVVAKQLIELMDGRIGVESVPGEGSLFWFELRAAAQGQFEHACELLEGPAARRPVGILPVSTLLYIEDNPANLALVEQLVAQRSDLQLLTATTALHGITLAREHRPAVVLMDINLPDISGFEALRILRGDPGTNHIPIIAITANAMAHDLEEGALAGFSCYLTKPFKINAFYEALNQALAGPARGQNGSDDVKAGA